VSGRTWLVARRVVLWLREWLNRHFSDILVGIVTTVLGVWLGYVIAVKQDLKRLELDQRQRTQDERSQEEATARSILQEFQANAGLIELNTKILDDELRTINGGTFGGVPLITFYEDVAPRMYGSLPRVMQAEAVRHRIKTICQAAHEVNELIRLRQQMELAGIAQPMNDASRKTFRSNMRTMDSSTLQSLEQFAFYMTFPDTIWTMETWPSDSVDNSLSSKH